MANRPLQCVVSVSGVRGIVGETLDADQVLALAAAFGRMIGGGTVIVGRDSRPTGEMLARAVAAGLQSVGCSVIDIGIAPTPTVPIMIAHHRATGGIQISASHNPVQWNALKLFNAEARNIDQAQLDSLLKLYNSPFNAHGWRTIGGWRAEFDAIDVHLQRIYAAVDVDLIRSRKLRVFIDSVNGAGSVIAPKMLKHFDCKVVAMHTRPDQVFPRDPEPTAENLTHTAALVKEANVDVGFVQDPDADRLAIIDEHGVYIGEEYTLVLCAAARIEAERNSGKPLVACTNLSTSRMLEDVAARAGASVMRSKVGEANVVDAMQKHQALVGGEGNGGVIDPRVVWGRDSQIGIALILEYLARKKKTVSQVVAEIPRYAIHKEKVAMDRLAVTTSIEKLAGGPLAKGATLDTRDGIKLIWPDRWVHLRASGTEPVSRIIAEAPTAGDAEKLAAQIREAVGAKLAEKHHV